MSFQKCPACSGLGKTQNATWETLEISICHVCKGSGIINKQIGLPPDNNTRKTTKEEMDLYKLNESKLYDMEMFIGDLSPLSKGSMLVPYLSLTEFYISKNKQMNYNKYFRTFDFKNREITLALLYFTDTEHIQVGYSVKMPTDNKIKGLSEKIAMGRALSDKNLLPELPQVSKSLMNKHLAYQILQGVQFKIEKEHIVIKGIRLTKPYHKPGIHRNVVGHKAGVFNSK